MAAALAVLAVLAAVGVGLASSSIFRPPPPTPRRVSVTFTPAPTPSPEPYDEATLFRQPVSSGCATANGAVWVVTNGGGLLRYDGKQWDQVDGTLRSLTRVACSADTAYAVGLVGSLVVGGETTRQIRSLDIGLEDLWGVSPMTGGAYIVGGRGSIYGLSDAGEVFPFPPVTENLFDVVAFSPQSAWAVGDHGITYRLDQRGWSSVTSGQDNALRSIAGTTAANAIAVGDAGTIVGFGNGAWTPVESGVDVVLRDVIVDTAVWIAGDRGTLLTASGVAAAPFRKIDVGTTCDLVSLFSRGTEVWVLGKGAFGGGIWRVRASDGAVMQHFGGC